MITPTLAEFRALAKSGKLVPVCRQVLADLETPVSAFRKVDEGPYSFLLESVEGEERWGRFSLLGSRPSAVFVARGDRCELHRAGTITPLPRHPLEELEDLLLQHQAIALPSLPQFCGGAVGYLGYDAARWFEPLPAGADDDLGLPTAVLLWSDVACVFDNVAHTLTVVTHARGGNDPDAAYRAAAARVAAEVDRLCRPMPWTEPLPGAPPAAPRSAATRSGFVAAAARVREQVLAGEVHRVVLSHRMTTRMTQPAFEAYRALRVASPSSYMFFLRLGEFCIAGSSPQVLVRRADSVIETRPIAGSRPRGRGPEEDLRTEEELLASEPDRAEHVLGVDLGRGDLGRVSAYGTVETPEFMRVERRSQEMHLVSHVCGWLRPELRPLDIVRACFPAGAVTGAPKRRAMEIIAALESQRRGVYAGAVGHFDYHGNVELCVALRTLVERGGTVHWGVGAGVAAESDPEQVWEDSLGQGRALWQAVQRAELGVA